MKIRNILVIVIILAAASIGFGQAGGNTKGYKLRHVSFGNVVFTKGAFRAKFNLNKQSVGCVQATAAMIKFGNKDCVGGKAVYTLINVVEKGGKYYLLIHDEAPSGNTSCDACRRCGADGATALIFIEIGPRGRTGKRQSIPLNDCNSFSSTINATAEDAAEEISFKGGVANFRTRSLVEANPESYYELTDWRYDRRSPEKGIVAVKKEKVRS